MKKLIAISVVFALVAGAAFAADVGAEVIGMTDIIKGDTGKIYALNADGGVVSESNKVSAGGWPGGLKRIRVVASGENDEGTFGGWFRFETYGPGNPGLHGYAFWKPIEQVKFLLGTQPDGLFGADGMTRWGFYQVGGDVGVPKEDWKFGDSFYQGWGDNGGVLTLTPTDGLEINLAIPYNMYDEMKYIYLSSTFQIAYTAEGIGKFALTYKSGKGNVKAVDPIGLDEEGDPVGGRDAIDDPGKLWLFAGLTMIENLEIDVGLGYRLPHTSEGYKKQDPIAIGLGAHYNAGDFGVKGRLQVELAGSEKEDPADAYKDPMNIVFDVLPYYNISESLSFLFSAGVDYTMKSGNEVDKDSSYAKVGFHVTPYITIKSSWWAPNFYAGIDIRTDGKKFKEGNESKEGTAITNWSVPIGIVFAF